MTYNGIIKDKKGNPVAGAQYGIINAYHPGEIQGSVYAAGTDGSYSIDISNNFEFLNVYAPGYQSTVYSQAEVAKGVIILPKESPIKPWMVLSLVGLFVAYKAAHKSGKKKLSGIDPKDVEVVLLIAGGVIGFVILKQVLEFLGIWGSKDKKELDKLSTNPNSFWNPNYWQNINPNGLPYQSPLTEADAKNLISQIKDGFGLFNDSPEKVKGVFRSLHTKANASFLAWEYQKTEGGDLLAFIRNGGGVLPWDGLSDADVVQITDYVNQLPNF